MAGGGECRTKPQLVTIARCYTVSNQSELVELQPHHFAKRMILEVEG